MTPRSGPFRHLFAACLLALSVGAVNCGGSATLEAEDASALIQAQFPDSEVEIRSTRVEEDGSAVASTRFDENMVSFVFQPSEEGWVLEAVDFEGSFYYIEDLDQISTTMAFMADLATALERFKAANGQYPLGDTSEALHALVPDFMAEETQFGDAWQHGFDYESDGDDYTLISPGPDEALGSKDDLVLHTGEFVGADQQQRQG